MSPRAERLLHLLDMLQRQRRPVTAARLGERLGVSLRTVYRDIDSLRAQGAVIDGDAGVGFVLRDGYLLPLLGFQLDELEALVLGMRWVAAQSDHALAHSARTALARIAASLPEDVRLQIDTSGLFVPRWHEAKTDEPWLSVLRSAIREERKVTMDYVDRDGQATCRVIWPFAMAFFDPVTRVFAAWCELRGAFRHFRAERVRHLQLSADCYPQRRHALIRQWRAQMGFADHDTADGN